jgi:membrane protein
MRNVLNLFKDAAREFNEDKAPRLGAALAYYTMFSIAPLLLVAIAIAGFVFGQEAARGQIFAQMRGLIGAQGAGALQEMVASAAKPKAGTIATIIGVVTLLFGAAGVFGQLKDALNTIWEIEPRKSSGVWGFVRDRFLSLAMVLGVGFLLLVSLVLDTAVAAFGKVAGRHLPGGEALWHSIELVVSFGVVTVLFAMIFRFLPDIRIAWRDVWFGAAFTAILFVIGKFGLALYLGKKSTTSSYGAAGSLIVLLLWVYYSAQILFFGAEVTQVYARNHGSMRAEREPERARETRIVPARPKTLLPAPAHARAAQGKGGGAGKAVAGGLLGLFLGGLVGVASTLLVAVKAVKGIARLPRRGRMA